MIREMKFFRSITVLCALAIFSIASVHSTVTTGQVKKSVDLRLKKERRSSLVGGKRTFAYDPSWVRTFYKRRSFLPVWISDGKLRADADELLAVLRKAEGEGLNPADYSLAVIDSLIGTKNRVGDMDSASLADLDVLLTNSFLHYASDLHSGRVNPRVVNEEWDIHPRETDLACVLQQALDSTGIKQSLIRLCPARPEYDNLRKALAYYRSLPEMQDPGKLAGIRRLARGDSSRAVSVLRKRLAAWYPGIDTESKVFDQALEEAVEGFQKNHGIGPDGVVGKETMAALNRSREECAQQVVVNLERYRWLPDPSLERHIVVNIPSFELCVMENGIRVDGMRVVVGKSTHRTPLLSNAMTYIVFGPYWNVPQTIAAKEIVPQIIKNVSYLKKENIKVFEKEGDDLSEVDPDSVDWTGAKRKNLRFRMEPGAKNSLGSIKFMFPNNNNVYLHDTPAKSLFSKCERQFSHGCVRVEQPVQLAANLLARDTVWVKDEIRRASSRHGERVVKLPEPILVRLQYFTAWVDGDGTLQFRRDIYGWDDQVSKALRGIPVLKKRSGEGHFASREIGKALSTGVE